MSSYNRLFKNLGLYFLGNFATKILQFLFIPIYSLYVDAGDYGEFSYVLSIVLLVTPLLFCQVWEGVFRFAIDKKGEEYKVLSTATIFLISSMILYSILFLVINVFVPIKHSIYILLLGLVHALSPYWQYSSRALALNKTYTLSTIVSASVTIAINIFLIIVLHWGIEALYIANILGGLSIVLVIEGKAKLIKRTNINEWNPNLLKTILFYSFPLAINAVSWWLYTSLNNLIITHYLGTRENGIFSMATKFGAILSIFTMVINMAWLEESFRINEDDDKDKKFMFVLNNLTSFLFAAFVILVPVAAVAYKYVVFYDYKEGLILIPLVFLSAVFTTLTNHLGSAFLAAKDSKSMFWTTLFGGIVSLISSLILVNVLGMFGAVLGSSFGFISVYYLRVFILNRYKGYNLKWHNNNIMMMFIFLVPLNYFIKECGNIIWILITLGSMIVVGVWANKSLVRTVLSKIRNKHASTKKFY